jgi:hypothetical protein
LWVVTSLEVTIITVGNHFFKTIHRYDTPLFFQDDAHIGPNEPLGTKGPPLVGEEVRKDDVGKVGS